MFDEKTRSYSVIAGVLAAAGTGLSFAEPAKITVLQTGGVSGHLYPCPT